ncbi:hypothetical protein CKO28_23680 [Rhodovibrio sodomensis]|uniref:Uncharacterized protein n=1 Tax=Rhodovibrio sodomensis TaxID=1088 RepID=A0ABS1DLM0_9PROT|nr:hypothetical protein [Rhodovibrio sodomensis]MBK1671012.1 hypothetical protein [Rhodovibrio sodomensis]
MGSPILGRYEGEAVIAGGRVHRVTKVYGPSSCYLQPHDGPGMEVTQHAWKLVDRQNDVWVCLSGVDSEPEAGKVKLRVYSSRPKSEMPILREELWDEDVNGPIQPRRTFRIDRPPKGFDPSQDLAKGSANSGKGG